MAGYSRKIFSPNNPLFSSAALHFNIYFYYFHSPLCFFRICPKSMTNFGRFDSVQITVGGQLHSQNAAATIWLFFSLPCSVHSSSSTRLTTPMLQHVWFAAKARCFIHLCKWVSNNSQSSGTVSSAFYFLFFSWTEDCFLMCNMRYRNICITLFAASSIGSNDAIGTFNIWHEWKRGDIFWWLNHCGCRFQHAHGNVNGISMSTNFTIIWPGDILSFMEF